jgi:1-acyl-sn-glycerol-3-phosphate acyltransferase
VVPVGVIGTDKVQPIGVHVPRLGHKVTVHFGKPLEFGDRPVDSSNLRAVTDEIMMAIQSLTGQEYVPRYAPPKARDNGKSDNGQADNGAADNGAADNGKADGNS